MKESYERFLQKHVSIKTVDGRIDGIVTQVSDTQVSIDSIKFGFLIFNFDEIKKCEIFDESKIRRDFRE